MHLLRRTESQSAMGDEKEEAGPTSSVICPFFSKSSGKITVSEEVNTSEHLVSELKQAAHLHQTRQFRPHLNRVSGRHAPSLREHEKFEFR